MTRVIIKLFGRKLSVDKENCSEIDGKDLFIQIFSPIDSTSEVLRNRVLNDRDPVLLSTLPYVVDTTYPPTTNGSFHHQGTGGGRVTGVRKRVEG